MSQPPESSPRVLSPTHPEEVQECIQAALSSGEALEVRGGGSKRFYGRAVEAPRALSTAGLAGIVDYQPHELILVARPGTPLSEVERTLEAAGQMLAFEPPHWGADATLGGALACNLSGPRRFKAGAARDHLLGFAAVTGRGEVVRGGGRVVKNVTGYDLPKLMCGSFGTLAVLTEVVVKALPRAETERTLVFAGLENAPGLKLLEMASRSSLEPSGLAFLPAGLPLPDPVKAVVAAVAGEKGASLTAIRMEGPEPSVKQRCAGLQEAALQGTAEMVAEAATAVAKNMESTLAEPAILEADGSRAFWVSLRELEPLQPGFGGADKHPETTEGKEREEGEALWRFSVPPASGAALAARLLAGGRVRYFHDWGGALLWAMLPASRDPVSLHELAAEHGGTAQRVKAASGSIGGTDGIGGTGEAPVFSGLSPARHRLNLNLKLAFDPQRILNPGRMYPDL